MQHDWQMSCSNEPGVAQSPSDFEVPSCVQRAIEGMPVYNDGVKCELDAGDCVYASRRFTVTEEHWRKNHQFSVGQKRGGSGTERKEDIERQVAKACRKVRCQRFFRRAPHSQYFAIQSFAKG